MCLGWMISLRNKSKKTGQNCIRAIPKITKQKSHSQESTDEREKRGKITDENKYFFNKVQCDFGTLNQNNFQVQN